MRNPSRSPHDETEARADPIRGFCKSLIIHSFNTALRRFGRRERSKSDILPWIGRPLYEMFPGLDASIPASEAGRFIESYRAAFHPVAVPLTRPLPGLTPCLDRLCDAGVALAIATHRSETGARQILQGFGLLDRFPVLVGLERIRRTKPDPEPVLLALRELGVEPESAAMVGDTPDDMHAGAAAGARTVGVTTGIHSRETLEHAGAEIVVDSLDELPSRLGV